MSRSVRLRRWQKEALDAFEASAYADFLTVATPGAGKTTFAVAATIRHLAAHPRRRAVIVVPTTHLKIQWARAAAAYGLQLDAAWTASTGKIADDVHGIVVTYAQVATSSAVLATFAAHCIVVCDEIHHAGDEQTWGAAALAAFARSPRRLALSGTPFRSDTNAIPFVRYDNDEAVADYTYGYTEALRDPGVVRPVSFGTFGGQMEWTDRRGRAMSASFEDPLDPTLSAQRLRTALAPDGQWLRAVLAEANEQLMTVRTQQPDAGGLVIASDQDHARAIATVLRNDHAVAADVVVSDDPGASDRIARFATGSAPWLVSVRMVSEGVDIPRLRVGVFATTTRTELFFRQVVGRFVRHTGGSAATERAWLFLPDDPALRTHAATIEAERRHSLRARWEDGERHGDAPAEPTAFDEVGEDDQLSLFAALSAEVTGGRTELAVATTHAPDETVDTAVHVELPLPPTVATSGRAVSVTDTKRALRDRNATLAKRISALTGHPPKFVNWHLNRAANIARISDATVAQLDRRAAQAERWLAQI